MKLNKSNNALKGCGITKFSLNCIEDKDKWLNLINILYKNNSNTAIIIKGLYDNKKDIVLKIGIKEAIEKEFEIAEELKELPNFIRYYCKFICYDDIRKIIKNEKMISTYYLCKNGKEQIGILTMNYYKLGSIGNFNWNENNINILKNVLTHTVFTVLCAYKLLGFIRGDLHADNVLLKKTKENKEKEIDYFYKKQIIDTFEIRIMDFEKSKINLKLELKIVLDNIEKLFNSIIVSDIYSVKFNYKNELLRKMKNKIIINNISPDLLTKRHYEKLEIIINTFYIEYIK